MCAAAVLGRPDDVIARMRKRGWQKTAVVVPLRPDIRDAVALVVGQAKDVAVAAGSPGMNAMSAVQLPPAPEAAGAQEFFRLELRVVLEDKKAAMRHFAFQRVDDLGRRRVRGGEIDPRDLCADGIERGDLATEFLDDASARRRDRWKLRCGSRQGSSPSCPPHPAMQSCMATRTHSRRRALIVGTPHPERGGGRGASMRVVPHGARVRAPPGGGVASCAHPADDRRR